MDGLWRAAGDLSGISFEILLAWWSFEEFSVGILKGSVWIFLIFPENSIRV